MSPTPLGQLIGPALGIAVSPVSIVAIILLLLSPRAKTTGVGFLLGWSLGIVTAVTVFALLSGVVSMRVPVAADTVLAMIQLFVGILLLVFAAVLWSRRRRTEVEGSHTPAWMRTVDRVTFPIAFAVGFAMAANPPNLLLSLAGGVSIGMAGFAGAEVVVAVALFTLVAASTVLVPVIGHFVAADALQRPFDRFRVWLAQHNSAILTTVFVVLGLLSVGQGLSALMTG